MTRTLTATGLAIALAAAALAEPPGPTPPAPVPVPAPAPTPAPPPKPAAARGPVLVMIESDPWLDVIGSDSPTFALYDDGLVLYQRRTAEGKGEIASATLDASAAKRVVDAALGAERSAWRALKESYEATETTDQPTTTIHDFTSREGRRAVSVYGQLRVRDKPEDGSEPAKDSKPATKDLGDRAKAPAAFLRAFDALAGYTNAAATTWLPERVEVMIWPFEYAKGTPVEWPADWPGLADPRTRAMGEDGHSLFLDVKHLDRLRALRRGMQATQPLALGGKKWAMSFRLPFPAESRWMR